MLKTILHDQATRIMLALLTFMAGTGAMYLAKPVLAPVLFAVVVGVVASPVADRLNTVGVPRIASASVLLAVTSALLVLAFLVLEPLLSSMSSQLPKIRREVQEWIDTAAGLLRGIETISEEIEQTIGAGADGAATSVPTVMDALWLAPNFGAQVFIFAGTLFFFVLTRSELYEAAGQFKDHLFRADRAVARYFSAVTIVNVGLGVAVASVMAAVGLNNAVLWGLAAAILNFILYLGPLMIMFGLMIAGLVQFTGISSIVPFVLFLSLNLIEAQFITPVFVGKRLQINPLAVFLAIVFGLWLWGPVGAIVALPVVLWFGVLIKSEAALAPHAKLRA